MVSTSGPPTRSPTTTRMIALSFASVSRPAFHRPGRPSTTPADFEHVQIPVERPATAMPPPNTHRDPKVSAMPQDVHAVDELDPLGLESPDLDSLDGGSPPEPPEPPGPDRARRRGGKGEQTRQAIA